MSKAAERLRAIGKFRPEDDFLLPGERALLNAVADVLDKYDKHYCYECDRAASAITGDVLHDADCVISKAEKIAEGLGDE